MEARTMFDLFKKGVLMGLGALTMTKEKIEQAVDELIKKGELSQDERAKAIKDLLKKAEEQEKAFADRVSTEVNETIKKLGVITKKDLERLEKKIDELRKKMSA
ncbi:polyhydroxyalkanoate synthesis regulator [candidate division KSB1 bacterium]|nr:MAG: polyhydroxyalkanoate synthesis regulator [candidate division KSB1 bacterium]